MGHEKDSLLGKATVYDHDYDPGLLFPLARMEKRARLAIDRDLPFVGEDVWTAYELSWLNAKGKPQVAIAEFRVPCDSPMMIESKSFKLYLNSLNHKVFVDHDALVQTLQGDLSAAAGAGVGVRVLPLRPVSMPVGDFAMSGKCIDALDVGNFVYAPDPDLLSVDIGGDLVEESVYSDLLRSNCPVTGQPDWATVCIHYTGGRICHESLLRYIVSFRQCQDFHEHCVERIFTDVMTHCRPHSLSVYARYTRRGGLDINPYRATPDQSAVAPALRSVRQ
ncbi:MAG: NADPH-dependent 7-cyano-7-deazaguanine reductase QueF [Oleiphilaceae bacterium]|nr:NADPH-dependent 7-cyano-7-deazaguanine reductase QueF [Oleiphilaceae bacterium]